MYPLNWRCESNTGFDGASRAYRRIMWLVIAIDAGMFVVELSAGFWSQSMALRADALDFLGDSVTYAMTRLVIGRPLKWRARAVLLKDLSLAGMALWVLLTTLYQVFVFGTVDGFVMGGIGFMALMANVVSALLLLRYRNGDANVRSVWLCSHNDAIGNLAVIVAAGAVFLFATPWPDLLVAFIMSALFAHSATRIIRQARAELRQADAVPACAV